MHVYFGTVVRGASVASGGELVRLDWGTKQVIRRVPIFPENPRLDHDPNPRGNTRGCRGLVQAGDKLLAADYHTVRVFDLDLEPQGSISHGCMVGLHEIFLEDEDHLWVCATTIDAMIKISISTGIVIDEYWPRTVGFFREALGVEPMDIDKSCDNRDKYLSGEHSRHPSHLHVNAVICHQDRLIVLFNKPGVVADLRKPAILLRDSNLIGSHNLSIIDSRFLLINDTDRGYIRQYNIDNGQEVKAINLRSYDVVKRLYRRHMLRHYFEKALKKVHIREKRYAMPIFVRGQRVVGNSVFVGISPACIVELDFRSGELIDFYQYSDDVNVCVHGLEVIQP